MPTTRQDPDALGRAAAFGAVSGTRTFLAPAALALRGRFGKVAKFVVPALAAAELVADKLPATAPRSQPFQGLAGRLVGGGVSGYKVGGAQGARVGVSTALTFTYVTERFRALLGTTTGAPDPLLAVIEDASAIPVAALAAAQPEDGAHASADGDGAIDLSGAATAEPAMDGAEPERRPTPLTYALRGLVAAAAGTAAMTTAQTAFIKLTEGEPSSAPGEIGRRIIEGVAHEKVPRDKRSALNDAMHTLYGTTWGLLFGLALGSLRRRPRPSDGIVFGVTVWGASLVELPGLDVAPPIWEEAPIEIASDLSFHLVYGAVAITTYELLAAASGD